MLTNNLYIIYNIFKKITIYITGYRVDRGPPYPAPAPTPVLLYRVYPAPVPGPIFRVFPIPVRVG